MMTRALWGLVLAGGLLSTATAQNMTPGNDPGGATTPGTGTVYYVSSSDGNNNDSGLTTALAWQTISRVNNQAFNPGDTILFKRGDTFSGAGFSMDRSGTSGNPIIFGAYGTGARPKITGNTVENLIDNKSWIVMDRLHFTGGDPIIWYNASNITFQYGEISDRDRACLKPKGNSSNILIQFSKIHECGQYYDGGCGLGCPSHINGECIYLGTATSAGGPDTTHDVIIRSNEIYECTDEAVDIKPNMYNVTIEDNIMHTAQNNTAPNGGSQSAIVIQGPDPGEPAASNVIIRRNVIHNWKARSGIWAYGNPKVHNNLMYNMTITTLGGIAVRAGDGDYYHNTLHGMSTAIHGSCGSCDIRHNLGPTTSNNMASTSGLYVNAAGGNFQLAGGSAARNLGSVVGGVTTDIVGVTRPQGAAVDYGAYELPVGGVAPSAPVNLRIDAQVLTLPTVTVSLGWGASVTGSPTSYTVYWDTTPATYGNSQSAGLALVDDVVGLTPGLTYYFNVTATNASGESLKSNTVVVAPANGDWTPPPIIVMLVKGPSLLRPMVKHIR